MIDMLLVGLGALLIAAGVFDIVATVLHPEVESQVSSRFQQGIWWALRGIHALTPRRPDGFNLLTWGVPLMVAGLIALWLALFTVGFALIYTPWIGNGAYFSSSTAISPTFSSALYFSGVTTATLGYGDILPVVPVFRGLAVLQALLGTITVAFSVSYLLALYPALTRRRQVATALDAEVAGQASALPMLRRYLGNGVGWDNQLTKRLRELALELLAITESHEQHAVLYYAHTRRVQHSLLRLLVIARNLVAALRYTLSPDQHRALVFHPDLIALEQSLHYSLRRFSGSLHLPSPQAHGDGQSRNSLEREFATQQAALQQIGLNVHVASERAVPVLVESRIEHGSDDEPPQQRQAHSVASSNGQALDPANDLRSASALEAYITFRRQVDPHIAAYAHVIGYKLEDANADYDSIWWTGDREL
ncbi:MAG: two pore domain potassium channel family protein [Roseiflexaceae bacterium]|nr:two pore domain potassium channel family protein [Roseiflexaceae bacterium]